VKVLDDGVPLQAFSSVGSGDRRPQHPVWSDATCRSEGQVTRPVLDLDQWITLAADDQVISRRRLSLRRIRRPLLSGLATTGLLQGRMARLYPSKRQGRRREIDLIVCTPR